MAVLSRFRTIARSFDSYGRFFLNLYISKYHSLAVFAADNAVRLVKLKGCQSVDRPIFLC